MDKKIKIILENLKKKRMLPFFVKNENEACNKIFELIKKSDLIGFGYSETVKSIGIIKKLKDKKYRILDRFKKDLRKNELAGILNKALLSDVFITGANAITQDGKIVNKDGMGTRCAPMIYGPKRVVVVVGKNKIVKDVKGALYRIEHIAAPLNCKRKKLKTPCIRTGYCVNCSSEDRICCVTVIFDQQKVKDRIKVIIIDKNLGF